MAFSQNLQLLFEAAATGVLAAVVVAEHAGQGNLNLLQHGGNALASLTEVTNHQQGIRPQTAQQLMVLVIPLVVDVPGNGQP